MSPAFFIERREAVRAMLDPRVEAYIREHDLYGKRTPA